MLWFKQRFQPLILCFELVVLDLSLGKGHEQFLLLSFQGRVQLLLLLDQVFPLALVFGHLWKRSGLLGGSLFVIESREAGVLFGELRDLLEKRLRGRLRRLRVVLLNRVEMLFKISVCGSE